jgi:hypothetical protein
MNKRIQLIGSLGVLAFVVMGRASAGELSYQCSEPPLSVTFDVAGHHYNGEVHCGNLFLQSDIPDAPVVRWPAAKARKLYTLIMLDFDGNANGSSPDPVSSGENSPVRHWIVGNIPGDLLRQQGYIETNQEPIGAGISIVQAYRAPHIPVVSDRYGIYLFEQAGKKEFEPISGSITNFDYASFLKKYDLGAPRASNFFVAVYVSESPFSGKPFHGNDVSQIWHKGYGQAKLTAPN